MSRISILVLFYIGLHQLMCCSTKGDLQIARSDKELILFSGSLETIKLNSNKKQLPNFRLPIRIKKVENYLFITDLKRDAGMVAIYDLVNDTYIKSIIPKGAGPYELSAVSSVVGGNDGKVYFYDVQSLRLLSAELDFLVRDSLLQPVFFKSILSDQYEKALRIVNISDSTFVAYTLPGIKGRFSFLNSNFSFTGLPFGEYPPLDKRGEVFEMTEISYYSKILGNLYTSSIVTTPVDNILLVAHHNVDLIEMYNYTSGQLIKRIVGPDQNFPPKYVINKSGQAAPCLECRCGYSSPQITSCCFAVLRLHKLYKDLDSYLSRYIYVFDLNGKLNSILELDAEVSEFVIDEERGKIYAIAFDEEYALLSYDLPKSIGKTQSK